MFDKTRICIVGLGYVGLPLAVEFGKKYNTIGFDINSLRINELLNGFDRTRETNQEEIKKATELTFTNIQEDLGNCNVFIVTVPTPIDNFKKPDLRPLISATKMVGEILKKGDIVIYESTVYPGCTEEDCVPILEKTSGLKFNQDFFCGYSPERINPGDKVNTLTKIRKVTSGSTVQVAHYVNSLYQSILEVPTFMAASIKVAEASKAIENAQRDVNISFVNELALIFDKMGINTNEVLEAAGSKWNFLKFKPGLVGGHCIGVDPYYMIHKAESLGYYPAVIGAGRRVNDNMGIFVANKVIKLMIQKGITIKAAKVIILGITFKENCPDIRNTRVVDIYEELKQFELIVDVYDPWANKIEVEKEYGINLINTFSDKYDAIIVSVAHDEFKIFDFDFYKNLSKKNIVIVDLKGIHSNLAKENDVTYWSL